jgi:hypothetical protein
LSMLWMRSNGNTSKFVSMPMMKGSYEAISCKKKSRRCVRVAGKTKTAHHCCSVVDEDV